MTITIFCNTPDTIFYCIGSGTEKTNFKENYDKGMLESAISSLGRDGIKVDGKVKDGTVKLSYSYSPS